jgi:RNA polymerase sigma-70 factor, ECF subfamily
MNQRSRSDEWLMLHVAQGHREHLESLIRRYASPLLTFIQRLAGDRHRSEELFQEVFLAVWRKRDQYGEGRPFKPWLYAIALNKCRAAFRSRGRSAVGLESDDGAATPAAPGPSPVDALIATETASLVAAAVDRLPPQQRAVVALRVWQGLSYSEIGDTIGCSEPTVRSHMHHGLAALRKHLEPHLSGLFSTNPTTQPE